MPRAGSGGGHSSSHRSSGGHSSSRSSGGHRISSGGSHSRAGSGRSSGFRAGSGFGSSSHRSSGPSFHGAPPPPPVRGPGMPPPPPFRGPGMPPPPPPRRFRRRSYRRTYSGGASGGCLVTAAAMLIVVFILITMFSLFSSTIYSIISGSSSVPASTRTREKLNSGLSFDSRCIVDEIDWFDSVSSAGKKLKPFYDKTGVQPYIVLLKYHPELTTDSQKEAYAQEYYENNINNEATFLYMYFAEKDQDNDVGYMCYVNGKQVDSVMDPEAVDIFWSYLDRNWYSDMSTDGLFENTFTKTAEAIMTKSKAPTNIVYVVIIGAVIIGVIIAIIIAANGRRRKEQDSAETTSQP